MNFLGHLYFSNNDHELMYANLLGDFIKGSHFEKYPKKIQDGIILHREIDHYIDHHPAVVDLLHKLYDHLPRIAGIAVDLYFDHLLALNWKQYHSTELRKFVNEFYDYDYKRDQIQFSQFWFVIDKIKEGDWLYNYQFEEGLNFACSGLSKRISFENNLHTAPQVFQSLKKEIVFTFEAFMSDAQIHFQEFIAKNNI